MKQNFLSLELRSTFKLKTPHFQNFRNFLLNLAFGPSWISFGGVDSNFIGDMVSPVCEKKMKKIPLRTLLFIHFQKDVILAD